MLTRTLAVTVLVVLASAATHARDNGQYTQVAPDIKRWVEGLTDDRGRGCCATADGFRPEEVEWDMTDSAYRVMINGQWFKVPDGAVIKSTALDPTILDADGVYRMEGPARVFTSERNAMTAINASHASAMTMRRMAALTERKVMALGPRRRLASRLTAFVQVPPAARR